MHGPFVLVLDSICFVMLCAVARAYIGRRRSGMGALPLPPGPKKLPLIGNMLDMPKRLEWETYLKWSKEYNSDIIHLNAVGTNIVIINTLKAASDLLDKRSAVYSSRAERVMVSKLMGWGWLISAMPYGDPWRVRRRLFQKHFHQGNPDSYLPRATEFIQCKLLPLLLDSPNDFVDLIRHTLGGITLSLAYGIPIRTRADPYITLVRDALYSLGPAAIPGKFLVDSIPLLQYLPEFIPGAGFKRKAREWSAFPQKMRNEPFKRTIENLAEGVANPSFTATCLEELGENDGEETKEVIKDVAAILYAAGADTSVSAILSFIHAMMAYPETQRRAREELDRVVGRTRLPTPNDSKETPYLNAVIKEVLRWKVITPIAVPHLLTEDDTYEGYHIPAGSIVTPNVWAMLQNENEYPNPTVFDPTRFLRENDDGTLQPNLEVLDPTIVAFGFGRRRCPGSHIAESIIWLCAASMLSVFDISAPSPPPGVSTENGENGIRERVNVKVEYEYGLVCRPRPFECNITPRSAYAEALVRSSTLLDDY